MNSSIGDKQRLEHMLLALTEIMDYTRHVERDEFLNNSMMRIACVKQPEIVGEAANRISEQTRILYPAVEWRKLVGLRNILVHESFGIAFNLVWQIIKEDTGLLKLQIEEMLMMMN